MEYGFIRNDDGNWVAPLPFKYDVKLTGNQPLVINSLKSLCKLLDKKRALKQQYMDLMNKLFPKGHEEPLVPGAEAKRPRWYHPHFAAYHPCKPNNIHVDFNASATFCDVKLHKVLLPGPDLISSLLGV